jgi:lipopolysaccharide biosynthesis regulator YciM
MMELETWHLLLLPLFFALGWGAARIDMRQVLRESRMVPQSYFRGLNYLLNEQPDQAIESFLELARLDPDTLELHFALGALFRRRGELDRALRIHQALADRADLDVEHRLKALFELGQDYHKSGLLDRAETVFKQLADSSYGLEAAKHLQQIYILEREWAQAIAATEQLQRMGCATSDADVAHFYCELALNAQLQQDAVAAQGYLQDALRFGRKSARPLLLLGDLARTGGDREAALEHWRRVEAVAPEALPLVAQRFLDVSVELDRIETARQTVEAWLQRHASADLFHVLFTFVAARQGWAVARGFAAQALATNPGLRVLDDWLQATANDSIELRVAQDVVHRQVSTTAYYQCGECGFRARQHFWQCPACARWESIAPERVNQE